MVVCCFVFDPRYKYFHLNCFTSCYFRACHGLLCGSCLKTVLRYMPAVTNIYAIWSLVNSCLFGNQTTSLYFIMNTSPLKTPEWCFNAFQNKGNHMFNPNICIEWLNHTVSFRIFSDYKSIFAVKCIQNRKVYHNNGINIWCSFIKNKFLFWN